MAVSPEKTVGSLLKVFVPMVDSVAILGGQGQLAFELQCLLASDSGRSLSILGREDLDVTNAAQVDAVLSGIHPQIVINCAAQTQVDVAESTSENTFAINATGAGHIGRWCAANRARLVYISTDHVFGQTIDRAHARPWRETDQPQPVSVYARSKLAGEQATLEACPHSIVVRTCGLYGQRPAKGKGNFVQTMLRLAQQRPVLKVVDDQWCTPSSAQDVAQAIRSLLVDPDAFNPTTNLTSCIWHITNTGSTTWAQLAREIFSLQGLTTEVIPITTAEFNAPAHRPGYSVLDTSRFTQSYGELPGWKEALATYLQRLQRSE